MDFNFSIRLQLASDPFLDPEPAFVKRQRRKTKLLTALEHGL